MYMIRTKYVVYKEQNFDVRSFESQICSLYKVSSERTLLRTKEKIKNKIIIKEEVELKEQLLAP